MSWKLLILAILFLSLGFVLENLRSQQAARAALQTSTVPTALLDNGLRGDLLKEMGLVQRVPNPGDRWPSQVPGSSPNSSWFGQKTQSGPFVYAISQAQVGEQDLIIISEIQASSSGDFRDQDGDDSDWIEIWNSGEYSVNLKDWSLSDDPSQLTLWSFPEYELEPDQRLVVFASGKDRRSIEEFHTNFKLSKKGEYLALTKSDGVTIAHQFGNPYPKQKEGVSYGLATNGEGFLKQSSPGRANSELLQGFVKKVKFSEPSTLFSGSFKLKLTTKSDGATIRYTLDGSLPTETHGKKYSHPLKIDRSTVIRAFAYLKGHQSSSIETKSYLHTDSVLSQKKNPKGFPRRWSKSRADYKMDSRIVRKNKDELLKGLFSLPSVSVVIPQEELFGRKGIYSHPEERGWEWERFGSLEFLAFEDEPGFQIEGGFRILGNESRNPAVKKHSLRVNFRKVYGKGKLDYPLFPQKGKQKFDSLVLRSSDDSWVYHEEPVRESAQFVRDQWSRETEYLMGRLASRGRFVHVYLNGLYWGVYNLVERPDENFFANQLGGSKEDYLTFRSRGREIEGTDEVEKLWIEIHELIEDDLSDVETQERLQALIDFQDFSDYCLLHIYNGAEDWALTNGNNLRVYRQNNPVGPLKFLTWDADSTFASGWDNDSVEFTLFPNEDRSYGSPGRLFERLCELDSFKSIFKKRAQLWLGDGGLLSARETHSRYLSLLNAVESALQLESARWGDVRRSQPYTVEKEWAEKKRWMLTEWFPKRTSIVISQLLQSGLYPQPELIENLSEEIGTPSRSE